VHSFINQYTYIHILPQKLLLSITLRLSGHLSDQHTQGIRRGTSGQIPRPNTIWITAK
jgi:hypothetical protein